MKETKFKDGFNYIGKGLMIVLASIWHVIITHKLLCAFIVSLFCNVWLAVSVGKARAERDNRDSVAYQAEHKADSLTIITGGK